MQQTIYCAYNTFIGFDNTNIDFATFLNIKIFASDFSPAKQAMWKAVLLILLPGVALGDVLVKTKYGLVDGHTVKLHTGKIINSFLGIPFAKPPIGNLRFTVRTWVTCNI